MVLTRHADGRETRWALDGRMLPAGWTLAQMLAMPKPELLAFLRHRQFQEPATGPLLSPIEPVHEVWASGVTYLRSRMEREAESSSADVYAKVYDADRPELFFKSVGWRVAGHREPVRIRKDSAWNVPEPELTLVLNRGMELVGYTAGDDLSSRSIEGENPLYLPQAKMYDGACALGKGIVLCEGSELGPLDVRLKVTRGPSAVFEGEASTGQMKRSLRELTEHLGRETTFPHGAFLMTGTGIVPGSDFTLLPGDTILIRVGEMELENTVAID